MQGRWKPALTPMAIKMYGPAFDGSGKTVSREVPESDVAAYQRAGYVIGDLSASAVAAEAEKPKDIVTKAKPKGRSKK